MTECLAPVLEMAPEPASATVGDAGVILTTGVSSLAGADSGTLDIRQHIPIAACGEPLTLRQGLLGPPQTVQRRLSPVHDHSHSVPVRAQT